MRYFAILLLSLSLFACGIKRDNPLDPNGNNSIVVPADVGGISANAFGSGAATRYVRIEWISNNPYNTDGYYVYRGLGYYSAYAVVDTVLHAGGTAIQSYIHSGETDPSVTPGDYWYRVSAFKRYSAGDLEGRLSTPVFVRVGN